MSRACILVLLCHFSHGDGLGKAAMDFPPTWECFETEAAGAFFRLAGAGKLPAAQAGQVHVAWAAAWLLQCSSLSTAVAYPTTSGLFVAILAAGAAGAVGGGHMLAGGSRHAW